MTLTSGGVVTATTFNATSDRTLKDNIKDLDLEYSINLFNKLNPVEYNFKSEPGRKRFGFIAQEIEKITENENLGLHFKDPKGESPQTVCYQELIGPMVKIINNLLLRVSELEKIIANK